MKNISLLLFLLISSASFAQLDSVSIHSRNAAIYKAPSRSTSSRWFFTYWEEQDNTKYFYSNGRLVKKSIFSKSYNDTSQIFTYTYDNEGYLIRSDYYNIYKGNKMQLAGYNTYERSADKKSMRQKVHTWYDQFNGVTLYTITDYKYDDRNEIISTHERSLWLNDSTYRTSRYFSENRTYLNQKSKKYISRIDSTYDNFANLVVPSYQFLLVYDQLERIRIILRYGFKQNEWQLLNKDSLVYKNQEEEPQEYHRISNTNESSMYFSNMKWNDFRSANIVSRLFNLSYLEYDLYSYNQILKSTSGEDTIYKRFGYKLDSYGSKMYYEYVRNINSKLYLRNKFAEYYDEFKNQKLFYSRVYDTLSNTWSGMNGSIAAREYNSDNTVKSFTTGNMYGDSSIFYFDRIDYVDYVDAVLGANNFKIENIKIYPNPTSDFFYINSNNKTINDLAIYNTFSEKVYALDTYTEEAIDLRNFPAGLYFIKFYVDGAFYSYKIITNR